MKINNFVIERPKHPQRMYAALNKLTYDIVNEGNAEILLD